MAAAEYDVWLNRLNRESGVRASIIISGNTTDIIRSKFSTNGSNIPRYQTVMEAIIDCVYEKGYTQIVKWDRVDGIDGNVSHFTQPLTDNLPGRDAAAGPGHTSDYDLGDEDFSTGESTGAAPANNFKSPDNFFPYVLQTIRSGNGKTAFILDYSDYLFGNANSLSEKERDYLATLRKAMEQSQSYQVLSGKFQELGSLIILVTQNSSMIPPAFYLNNPLVCTINVPLPGRTEREVFIDTNLPMLRITQDLALDKTLRDDFVDALDGFTLKEIAQLMKLSRQIDERMTFAKLINLYKYGEKSSPWEELSHDKLMTIEDRLRERVKGQDEAIEKVKEVIIRAYTGFSGLQHSANNKKPKGTLFFVGPTGVGKTELAKSIAEFVFGDENACIRFDMSEYNHDHSDQRLVGAPPGYVGYEAGGQLTNAIREKPFCVLLFDEIEKANGKILDKFLQILEDGRLTDGKGETVYFSESIIIFTSNIGANDIYDGLEPKQIRKKFIEAVKKHFLNTLQRPELLNRIGEDNILAFNFIDNADIFSKIARSKFQRVMDFVKEKYHAEIVFKDEADVFLTISQHTDMKNGGRGMLNMMEKEIVNPLSQLIFEEGEGIAGRRIIISVRTIGKNANKRIEMDIE